MARARAPPLREVLYRVEARPGAAPRQLPLLLSAAAPEATVETSVAHLDDRGHVWRILNVHGPDAAVAAARAAFESYAPPFLVERSILGEGPRRLILWYKYRPPAEPGFSHTATAFRLLGRDTVITDRTRSGVLAIRVLCRSQPGLQEFLRRIRRIPEGDFDVRLLYVGPPREVGLSRLTPAEEETVKAAERLGYYAVPRRAGVRAVAKAGGLSPSAAGYRLRQAERKLVGAYLDGA